MELLIERGHLRRRVSLMAAQPVEEIDQHFQSLSLTGLDLFTHVCDISVRRLRVILELEVLPLERHGVVDPELRSALEHLRECVLAEVPGQGARDVGEHEGSIVGQGVGKDVGQSGERVVETASAARDGAIGDDENSSDRVDVLLDLIHDTAVVELVLLSIASAGKSW